MKYFSHASINIIWHRVKLKAVTCRQRFKSAQVRALLLVWTSLCRRHIIKTVLMRFFGKDDVKHPSTVPSNDAIGSSEKACEGNSLIMGPTSQNDTCIIFLYFLITNFWGSNLIHTSICENLWPYEFSLSRGCTVSRLLMRVAARLDTNGGKTDKVFWVQARV